MGTRKTTKLGRDFAELERRTAFRRKARSRKQANEAGFVTKERGKGAQVRKKVPGTQGGDALSKAQRTINRSFPQKKGKLSRLFVSGLVSAGIDAIFKDPKTRERGAGRTGGGRTTVKRKEK